MHKVMCAVCLQTKSTMSEWRIGVAQFIFCWYTKLGSEEEHQCSQYDDLQKPEIIS